MTYQTPGGGRHASELAPPAGAVVEYCDRCKKPHRVDMRCWKGRYASSITASVLAEQGRTCWICGGPATSADHVVARSQGGGDNMENLRPACVSCNAKRYHRANPFDPDRVPEAPAVSNRWRS